MNAPFRAGSARFLHMRGQHAAQRNDSVMPSRVSAPFATGFGIWRRLRGAYLRMAALHQLQMLDDRMLRDIGLDRSDLASGRF